jgi:phosphatidylinositol alpha-1,6-mannosyltransferase
MKSLLISGAYYPPQVGGLSQFMSKLATTLGRERVCCLTGVPQANRTTANNGGPSVYRFPTAFSESKYVKALGWSAAITQIMIQERPQAVLLGSIDDGHLGLTLRRWFKLPLVVIAAGNEILDVIEERWPKPLEALQTADKVVAISNYTASFVQRAGVSPDKIEIVYPGFDSSRFRPLPPNPSLRQKLLKERQQDRVILSVGNLVDRKGHDTTIRALAKLLPSLPDVTYLIVGEGPYRPQLEALAAELNVQDHVVFAGRQADADLAEVYALSDLFVMASREQLEAKDVEGFGIVYLEAAACEKPVVGGRSGGVPEAVVDGVTGLLVDPLNVDELGEAMRRLLTDSDLATRLGQQGKLRATTEFTWEQAAEQIQAIIEQAYRENRKKEE